MNGLVKSSQNKNTLEAIKEATQSMDHAKLIILFAPYDKLEEASAQLHQLYPTIQSIGVSGTTLYDGTDHNDMLLAIGFLDGIEVTSGIIKDLDTCPLQYIKQIEDNVRKIAPGKQNTACIEFCTGYEERLTTTLNAAFGNHDISLIGGTEFGVPEGKNSIVTYNGVAYENACAYVLIKNMTGKIHVYRENIYKKENDIRHYATKVDTRQKALIELDNQPAADVYSKEMGITKSEIVNSVLQHPLGREVGKNLYICSMHDVGSNGELYNYKIVNANDSLYFLTLDDYDQINAQTRSTIKQDSKQISLVISVDCIYRYMLFQSQQYTSTYARNMKALCENYAGIISGGEQFNNQHINQTLVCIVFE